MSLNQRRVCQIEELPLNLPSQAGRHCNPRRVLVTERTNEASPSPKNSSRLIRRETASRLLDLAQNPPPVFKPSDVVVPKSNRPSPPRLTKTASWKSSKFFSRTMTSAEMLKGLKKLSVNPTSPTTVVATTTTTTTTAKVSEGKRSTADSWKIAKNRLCSGRKKFPGSSGVTISISEGTSKSSGIDSTNELLTDPPTTILRKKSEDEGIVCKKEDLISLMRKASKQGSPKARRASLKSASSSSLEPNKPAEEETEEVKEPVRRSSFETVKNKLKSTFIGSSSTSSDSKPNEEPEEGEEDSVVIVTQEEEDSSLEPLVSPSEDGPTKVVQVVKGKQEEASKVEWDDGSFVNPLLLGGAIEAFLKGMGGSATTEKRVSFKKN